MIGTRLAFGTSLAYLRRPFDSVKAYLGRALEELEKLARMWKVLFLCNQSTSIRKGFLLTPCYDMIFGISDLFQGEFSGYALIFWETAVVKKT